MSAHAFVLGNIAAADRAVEQMIATLEKARTPAELADAVGYAHAKALEIKRRLGDAVRVDEEQRGLEEEEERAGE